MFNFYNLNFSDYYRYIFKSQTSLKDMVKINNPLPSFSLISESAPQKQPFLILFPIS